MQDFANSASVIYLLNNLRKDFWFASFRCTRSTACSAIYFNNIFIQSTGAGTIINFDLHFFLFRLAYSRVNNSFNSIQFKLISFLHRYQDNRRRKKHSHNGRINVRIESDQKEENGRTESSGRQGRRMELQSQRVGHCLYRMCASRVWSVFKNGVLTVYCLLVPSALGSELS